MAIATLCALVFNANRGKDQAPRRMKDYLPFLDPWPLPSRYSDVDREVFQALGR